MGALSAAQLRDAPAGHPLGAAERDGLARFWAALIAPDPAPLRDFAAAPPAAPRGLGRAAVARLARLPHPVTGLDSLETRLLNELVGLGGGGGPVRAGQVIGAALRAGAAGPDLTGDLALLDSLHGLAAPAARVPLVALSGDGTMGGTEVSLTGAGARVHAGAADRVALNGWRSNLGGLRIDAPPGGEVPRAPL